MRRFVVVLVLLAALFAALDGSSALAQAPTAAPVIKPPPEGWPPADTLPFSRGPGYYFSLWKLVIFWLTFLVWVKMTDYLAQDCSVYKLNYALWNPLLAGPFLLTMILFWLIPIFFVGWFLMLLAMVIPPIVYIRQRNALVQDHEKIFTRQHIRHAVSDFVSKFGMKVSKHKKAPQDEGPAVKFIPKGGDDQKNQANLILARQSPGWVPAKQLVADMVTKNAELTMLDFTPQGVGVRFQIDGCWHNQEGMPRETADPLLAVLKKLGNANEQDRKSKQDGKYDCEYDGIKYQAKIHSQGVETGERAVFTLHNLKKIFKTLEELGMRAKLIETVKEQLREQRGIILLSTPLGGGYSALLSVVLRECDRYLRDFVGIEDVDKHEADVENVHISKFDPQKGENQIALINDLALKYPNVFVVAEPLDGSTVKALIAQCVEEDRLVITGVKAKECAEALLRILMMKVPAKDFAPEARLVINMRTVRKLCGKCREAYVPPAETLKKLGLAANQAPALHRPPTSWPEKEPPCVECHGMGYVGRTGIFEVLLVGEKTRKALLATPQLDAVRVAARKDGMRTLQEEGIVLVAKGVTSLDELLRVMKPQGE